MREILLVIKEIEYDNEKLSEFLGFICYMMPETH